MTGDPALHAQKKPQQKKQNKTKPNHKKKKKKKNNKSGERRLLEQRYMSLALYKSSVASRFPTAGSPGGGLKSQAGYGGPKW